MHTVRRSFCVCLNTTDSELEFLINRNWLTHSDRQTTFTNKVIKRIQEKLLSTIDRFSCQISRLLAAGLRRVLCSSITNVLHRLFVSPGCTFRLLGGFLLHTLGNRRAPKRPCKKQLDNRHIPTLCEAVRLIGKFADCHSSLVVIELSSREEVRPVVVHCMGIYYGYIWVISPGYTLVYCGYLPGIIWQFERFGFVSGRSTSRICDIDGWLLIAYS